MTDKNLPSGLDRRDNGRVRARYRDEAGKQHSKHFDGVRAAQAWLRHQRSAVDRGEHVSASAGRITFREYAEAWRAAQVHRPSSAAHVETMLRKHAYPVLGERPLGAIRPTEVQGWVRRLSETLAPSTVGVVHGIAASIFKAAVRDRCVLSSPCTGTRLPKAPPRHIEPLATETVEAIAAAIPPRYRALVILAAGTGLRQGEAVGLTVDRLNLLRRPPTLRVDRQLCTVNGGKPFFGPPKTQASYRDIPLPQVVVDALAAHLAEFPAFDLDVPTRTSDGPAERAALVFTTERGHAIRRTTFGEVWRAAVKAAGAPKGTGFHALRHYYVSLLIAGGASVKEVQARVGHATAAETLDIYAHLWPDSEEHTRDAIDSVLGRSNGRDTAGTQTAAE